MIPQLAPALVQTAPTRDAMAVAADVALVVVALFVVVAAVALVYLFAYVRGLLQEIRLSVRQNMGPVSDRARSISDNVEFVTQVVRSDVESLHASVKALSERLALASDRMEERIEEFNALMEVVQREAEGIFIDTASTVRGVRAGAQSITAGRAVGRGDADRAPGAPRSVTPEPGPVRSTTVTGAGRVLDEDEGVHEARDGQD